MLKKTELKAGLVTDDGTGIVSIFVSVAFTSSPFMSVHITNIGRSSCDGWRNVLALVWLPWFLLGRDRYP